MRFGLACARCLGGVNRRRLVLARQVAEPMPQVPVAAGEKLYCLSYAPFRGQQNPFDPTAVIPAAQIEEDLTQLAKLTECVRIYAVDQGLGEVVPIAAKLGLKVLLGFWLSNDPVKNKWQIDTAVALANRYPDDGACGGRRQ